jgi:hypothetical protein
VQELSVVFAWAAVVLPHLHHVDEGDGVVWELVVEPGGYVPGRLEATVLGLLLCAVATAS